MLICRCLHGAHGRIEQVNTLREGCSWGGIIYFLHPPYLVGVLLIYTKCLRSTFWWTCSQPINTWKTILCYSSSGLLTGKVKRGEKPSEGRLGWVAQDERRTKQSHPLWRAVPEKVFDIIDKAEAIGKTHGESQHSKTSEKEVNLYFLNLFTEHS